MKEGVYLCARARASACVCAHIKMLCGINHTTYQGKKNRETRMVGKEMLGFKGEKRESDVTERLQLKRNS